METPVKMLTDREAAKFLGISVQTCRNWRSQRRGPNYHKLGRSVRYKHDDLVKYLESQKIRVDG